eukprot:425460_1
MTLSTNCMNILLSILYFCVASNGERRRMDRFESFSQINVNLSWSINIRTQSMYVELIAPVTSRNSWIAFGISDSGGMKGADIALISLYHKTIYDLHSLDFVEPIMDKVQNYELRYLKVLNKHTIVQFARKLVTCDADDYDLDTTTLRHNILIAYHANDPRLHKTKDYQLYISRHQVTQTKPISLYIKSSLFTASSESVHSFIDIAVDEYLLLNQSDGTTQSFCYSFNNTEDRYVIAATLLDPTPYKNLVREANIHRCSSVTLDPNDRTIHVCDNDRDLDMECADFVTLANGSALTMPDTVHYSWTQDVYTLQIQFDLSHLSDLDRINVKGSGIRLYYTDTPRASQLGITKIDAIEFEIPPDKSSYALSVLLPNQCTDEYLPTHGVDIIFFTAHMHQTATGIRLDRIRYPNELETLYHIKQWDSDRQSTRMVHFTLQQGDMLRMTCYFDTSGKDTPVVSGINPEDEACQIYLGYVNTQTIPGINHVYSIPVSGSDTRLNPSYCGESLASSWDQITLHHSEHVYENIHDITASNNGLTIMDDTNEMCADLVFSKIDLIPNDLILRFDLVFITLYPGIILLLTILLSLYILDKVLGRLKPGIYAQFEHSISDKRKINVYLFSTLFFTILLFLLVHCKVSQTGKIYLTEPEYKIIYHEYADQDQMNMYPFQIPFGSNLVMLFFGIELFYRFKITWPLLMHHVFTICIVMTLCLIIQTTLSTASAIKLGFWYLMQVATEQPIFLALYTRKLQLTCCGCLKKEHYPYLFYVSAIWHYITKITTTAFISYYHIQSLVSFNVYEIYSHSFRAFLKDDPVLFKGMDCEKVGTILLTVLIPLLFSLQMYQGIFFWKLGVVRTKKTLIAIGPDEQPIIVDADADLEGLQLPEIPSGKSKIFEEEYTLDDDELNEVRVPRMVMQLTTSMATLTHYPFQVKSPRLADKEMTEMPQIVPSVYGYKSNTLMPYPTGSTQVMPRSVSAMSSARIQEILSELRRETSVPTKTHKISVHPDDESEESKEDSNDHDIGDENGDENGDEDEENIAFVTNEDTEMSSAQATGERTEIKQDEVTQEEIEQETANATSYPKTETDLQTWASTKL